MALESHLSGQEESDKGSNVQEISPGSGSRTLWAGPHDTEGVARTHTRSLPEGPKVPRNQMCAFCQEKQPERTPKREEGKAGSERLTCKGLCGPSAISGAGAVKAERSLGTGQCSLPAAGCSRKRLCDK